MIAIETNILHKKTLTVLCVHVQILPPFPSWSTWMSLYIPQHIFSDLTVQRIPLETEDKLEGNAAAAIAAYLN